MGSMVDRDTFNETVESLKEGIKAGDVQAMKWLGDLYYQGMTGNDENLEAAIPYWQMAADHGDASVAGKVGLFYMQSDGGFEEEAKGIPYLIQAAESGDTIAQFLVGMCYESEIGCKKDLIKAEKYYLMAAMSNHAEAQGRLGYLYSLKNDADGMYHWLICASLGGDKKSKELFDEMYRNGDAEFRKYLDEKIQYIKRNGVIPKQVSMNNGRVANSSPSSNASVGNMTHRSEQPTTSRTVSGGKIMNNNVERIRDAMAGAILGAVIAVIIFLLSLINSAIHFAGGLFSGSGTFEAMNGGTFAAVIVVLMIIGAAAGYALGYHWTQDEVIRKSINKWMLKHNK